MTAAAKADRLLQQGLFHHRQGQLEQALERYVEVLQGDPENADALYYVAVVACQGGEYQEGIKLARRARSGSLNARTKRAPNKGTIIISSSQGT